MTQKTRAYLPAGKGRLIYIAHPCSHPLLQVCSRYWGKRLKWERTRSCKHTSILH